MMTPVVPPSRRSACNGTRSPGDCCRRAVDRDRLGASNAWTARIAAGAERTYGLLRATAYGEGGIVGHATYGAIQGRAAAILQLGHVELDPGVGAWSSIQRDRGVTLDRIDIGPGVVARAGRFAAEVDYRFRVAGDAAPGSGPVLTVSAAF